jgi:hypothetical protein
MHKLPHTIGSLDHLCNDLRVFRRVVLLINMLQLYSFDQFHISTGT